MRLISKFALVILIGLSCFTTWTGYAQNEKKVNEQDPHTLQVIQSLWKFNPLRLALEDGLRGDGVHYPWMDDMRKLGVKQVAYTIQFVFHRGTLRRRIIHSSYYPEYYQLDVTVKDGRILRKIVASGLKRKLDAAVMKRARSAIRPVLKEWSKPQACGIIYLNLLDDENLPILDGITEIELTCKELRPKKTRLPR